MLAVHGCGAAQDILRACYESSMRFFTGPGAPAPVPGVWFEVPANRPFVPYPHAFFSARYRDEKDWDGIGEQKKTPCWGATWPFYYGHAPASYIGGHICGPRSSWEGKAVWGVAPVIVTDNEGRCPDCPKPMRAGGGLGVGGTSTMVLVDLTPEGGVAIGAETESGLLWYYTATGGAVGGGTAGLASVHVVTGSGGAVGGGTAPWVVEVGSAGGAVGGGTAPWSVEVGSAGGAVGGGTAELVSVHVISGAGGAVGGGTGVWVVEIPATGGAVGNSSSPVYPSWTTPAGGAVGGGTATATFIPATPTCTPWAGNGSDYTVTVGGLGWTLLSSTTSAGVFASGPQQITVSRDTGHSCGGSDSTAVSFFDISTGTVTYHLNTANHSTGASNWLPDTTPGGQPSSIDLTQPAW